ncbi:class I SAM-dependent DNA methyltransferase [Indiicoccus explosivorum]|uniref:class I SAM-dependent DNA methyltransferase n=1 Tax=Indiicoccus explosivorum TaxID=1917864 RepID=UPI000B4492A0|nr:class I SAM-dependent methyltransferase [Indiicoccus explosivorum]
MAENGSSVYDEQAFFENFLERRNRDGSPNNAMEEPVLRELIGQVRNKRVLDLGCGDARFGKSLLDEGCAHFDGIDGSANMVEAAVRTLYGTRSSVQHLGLEEWRASDEPYDVILSRMVFHYLPDIRGLFQEVYTSLAAAGQFVFSVQHPVLTSSPESAKEAGGRTSWLVDDYFRTGSREEPWIGERVTKYHRTVEDYFTAAAEAGFTVEALKECAPRPEHFATKEEFRRRQRIPLFLVLSCRK